MKKLSLRLCALLMTLLLVFGLAACGGEEKTDGDSASVTESTTTTTTESTEAPTSSTEDSSATSGDETTTAAPDSGDESTTNNNGEDSTTTPSSSASSTTSTGGKTSSITSSQTSKTSTPSGGKVKSWAEIKKSIPAGASGKTLTVVDWNPTKEMPGMDKVLTNFTKETGIKIEYRIVTYNSYFTKLTSQVTAGNAPDAARLQSATKQNLMNMQPINKLGYDFSDAAWDKDVLGAYTFNGNIYGVNMVGSPYYSPMLFYYNTRLIETYGLEDPYDLWKDGDWTWDKVWEMCDEFLDEVEGEGFLGLSTMAEFAYMRAHGVNIISYDKKANTFTHNLRNEKLILAFQQYAKYYDKGYISKPLTNNTDFDAGKLLFNISQGIAARNGSSYFNKLRSQGAVAAVPLPILKKGAKEYQIFGEIQAFGVPKTAKNAQLVPYFLRYYFDSANYNMKTLYNVKHADESIKYIRKTEPIQGFEGAILNEEYVGTIPGNFLSELKEGGAAQVAVTLESYIPSVEAAIVEASKFFASL